MPRMKGADLITEYLIDSKIPYVFGICGHGNVGILDSLYEARDRITLVSPRHEQVAAHMADAYFRVRHEAVATLTSCGPGSCNIVMPLALAISDSSALLAITANVPTSQFNRSPFQEINKHFQADFPNIIRPVVKRSFQPTRVDMKEALVLLGKLPRAVVRPPLVKIERAEVARIREALIEAGLLDKSARDAA